MAFELYMPMIGTSEKIDFIEFVEVYHKNDQDNHDITFIRDRYSGGGKFERKRKFGF